MKKFFQTLGMISLMCLTFFYTEKAVTVVKEVDDIMIKIKDENKKYKQQPIDAIIENNTIIPGLNGKEIDENKSYNKMKRIGSYNPNLLQYKSIAPNKSIKKIYDKYIIGGNKGKKMVSLIFIVDGDDNIDDIINILSKKKVKGNFFIKSKWLEKNNDKLLELIKKGHVIGNLSHNMNYSHSDFIWMDTVIKRIGKQDKGYCYSEIENKDTLQICELNKNYTIKPSIIVEKHPTIEVEKNLRSGSIISLPVTNLVEKELTTIINVIKSKGYQIDTLNVLLSEEIEI